MCAVMKQEAVNNIIKSMNANSLIIFVGAGVSANSGLPSWNELINEFRKELSLNNDDGVDNLKVAQFYFDTWGRQKYYQKLFEVFEKHSHALPNEIHEQIYKIQPKHLITTNYDTLLEDKMNTGITKYSVIKNEKNIPYTDSERYLIKMHGDLNEQNIVLKENDYLDYQGKYYMISILIKSLIMNQTILFIGYSLNDTTFNSIFRLIHNQFGENTKKAYFFTPSKPKPPIMEYYKNKGIHVLYNSEEEVLTSELGSNTVDFLAQISNAKKLLANNSKDLWNEIKFLDQFTFIESRDVVSYLNLDKKSILLHPDNVGFSDNEQKVFELGDNGVKSFLSEKTWINYFLGNEINHPDHFFVNEIFKPAFDLYKSKQYTQAKVNFRVIANRAYEKRDYINFLIAEFNILHLSRTIHFQEQPEIEEKPYNEDFSEVVEKLISTTNQNNSRTITFFRDNILSFKFLYRKIFKINELYDKLRIESNIYAKGGFSWNSNLSVLMYEFRSLNQFIESNCLCIKHYNEYHSIVNRYFESLLIATANARILKGEGSEETSTIIEKLNMKDIKDIIPYVNKKLYPVYLDKYSLDKISITEEALDFIINKAIELSLRYKESSNHIYFEELQRYVSFLSIVQCENSERLITLLKEYPIRHTNSKEIRNILKLFINDASLSRESYEELLVIINDHLHIIVKNNIELHYSNYYYYEQILKKVKDCIGEFNIEVTSFEDNLEIIRYVPGKIKTIEKYKNFISSFHGFFSERNSKLINEIINEYSKLPKDELNLSFLLAILTKGIGEMDCLRDFILCSIKKEIQSVANTKAVIYPDPLENYARHLFILLDNDYFSKRDILNLDSKEYLKGKNPFLDWLVFGVKDDEVIEKIMKYNSFNTCKLVLGQSDNDKKLLDEWAIRQFELEKV